jgi:probable phosphoglycerate mutase
MNTVLILARHGQTTANLDGRIDTHLPGAPLTVAGRTQVAELAAMLCDEHSNVRLAALGPITAVYSSVATRARESAAIIAGRLGLESRPLDGVQEIAGGEFDWRTDAAARDGYLDIYARWQRGGLQHSQPGGESGSQALARLLPAIESLAGRHEGAVTLLVAHAAAIELLTTALCTNVDGEFAIEHSLPSCATVVLVHEPSGWQCTRWHDVEFPGRVDSAVRTGQ